MYFPQLLSRYKRTAIITTIIAYFYQEIFTKRSWSLLLRIYISYKLVKNIKIYYTSGKIHLAHSARYGLFSTSDTSGCQIKTKVTVTRTVEPTWQSTCLVRQFLLPGKSTVVTDRTKSSLQKQHKSKQKNGCQNKQYNQHRIIELLINRGVGYQPILFSNKEITAPNEIASFKFHPLSLFLSSPLYRGELIVNNIGNLRRNFSVLFTKRQTNNQLIPAMLTVSDRIQIPSKTTHKDTGTQVNISYYSIN